jgi:hypothetical protein
LTATGISVQANTLTNEHELKIIFDAVLKGQKESLHIVEILMNALEAGSISGKRAKLAIQCSDQRNTS